MLLCFLLLYWVFIKSVFVVGSEVVAVCDILIFKNIAFCRNCLSCLFVMFCFGRVFDWEILECFFWLFVVIVWCNFVLVIYERLCFLRKKKNYGRTVHCKFPLLNPMSKWVWSDLCGCFSFDFGGYCLLWKRFCILNVALRAAQVKSFAK